MEKTWYYAVDGERYGPVTFTELRELVLSRTLRDLDLIWQPAFGPEWRNVGQVRELFQRASDAVNRPPDVRTREIPPLTGVVGQRPAAWTAMSHAFDRMVVILFRPFDMTRWFSIGFCGWLAYLGSRNAVNIPQQKDWRNADFKQQLDGLLDHLAVWPDDFGHVLPTLAVGGVLLLFALWMCLLRSRGDFMFLHRWYAPDTPIRDCWVASRSAGHALFIWRVVFFLITILLLSLIASGTYHMVVKPYLAGGKVWQPALLRPAVALLTAAILLGMGIQLVATGVKAFVVPLVYWNGISVNSAWRVVFALINQYPFAVMGYLLCGGFSALLAGLAILAFGLLTCCIGFIPLVLPFVGSVFLLPCTLLFRGYPVCFLSQWRHDLVPDAWDGRG